MECLIIVSLTFSGHQLSNIEQIEYKVRRWSERRASWRRSASPRSTTRRKWTWCAFSKRHTRRPSSSTRREWKSTALKAGPNLTSLTWSTSTTRQTPTRGWSTSRRMPSTTRSWQKAHRRLCSSRTDGASNRTYFTFHSKFSTTKKCFFLFLMLGFTVKKNRTDICKKAQ